MPFNTHTHKTVKADKDQLAFTMLSWLTVEDAVLPLQAVTKEHAILLVKYLATSQAMYTVTNIFLKISMGLFFLRFLIHKRQIQFVWFSISFYVLYSLAILFVICYLFRDPETILETRIAGHCIQDCNIWAAVGPMNYSVGALNSAIDFAFAILPILFLSRALMPMRTKATVCALLCFGAVSGICSVIRLCYVGNLNLNAKGFPNATAVITSLIELAVGIICISIAACRPLIRSLYSQTRSHSEKTVDEVALQTQAAKKPTNASDSTDQIYPKNAPDSGDDSNSNSKGSAEIRVETVVDIEKGMRTNSNQYGHEFEDSRHK